MLPFRNTLLSISAALGLALSFMMAGLRIYNGYMDQKLVSSQMELNSLQAEIHRGQLSQRLLQNLINELAPLAATKPELQSLLARYNITLSKPTSTGSNSP